MKLNRSVEVDRQIPKKKEQVEIFFSQVGDEHEAVPLRLPATYTDVTLPDKRAVRAQSVIKKNISSYSSILKKNNGDLSGREFMTNRD